MVNLLLKMDVVDLPRREALVNRGKRNTSDWNRFQSPKSVTQLWRL